MHPGIKTIYHPNFIAGYFLNLLPVDLLKQVPRSTRHDWNAKRDKLMFGSCWNCNNRQHMETLALINSNETLLAVNKALIKVIAIKKYMGKHITRIKDGISKANKTVLAHIKKAATVLGLNTTLSFIQITASFYRVLSKPKKCSFSLLNLCRVKHPNQLLQNQVKVIKEYAINTSYSHWPLSSIYHQILRDDAGFFGKSTFYKYAALLGITRFRPLHRRTNHKTGIRAGKCLQVLHADITEFKTADNKKTYIYLIIDNYSRCILSWDISHLRKACISFKNIERVCKEYLLPFNIKACQLVTDDGVENHGMASEFIKTSKYPALQHLVAHKNIDFSNSMIEYTNRRIKYDYLYRQHFTDMEELVKKFKGFVDDYNNRPNNIFNGLSNNEVLNGQDFKTVSFAAQIADAKKERIIQNKKIQCCFAGF